MKASKIGADDENPTTEFEDGTTVDGIWFWWLVEGGSDSVEDGRSSGFRCGFANWESGEGRWILG